MFTLSSERTSLMLWYTSPAFSGKNPDARSRTIRDAIEAAAGQTEDVKGVLRSLREMSEG
jgi:hypothetical protein